MYCWVLTSVYVPRVIGRRYGWDGEGRGSTVGLDQDAVCGDGGGQAAGEAQRGLQRSHTVELHPWQTAHEAWRVVALDQDGVDLPRFWKTQETGRWGGINYMRLYLSWFWQGNLVLVFSHSPLNERKFNLLTLISLTLLIAISCKDSLHAFPTQRWQSQVHNILKAL